MDESKWLESLQIGDTVLISSNRMEDSYSFAKVTKLTKIKIFATVTYTSGKTTEYIFNKNGTQVTSDKWNKKYLYEPTQERKDEIIKYRLTKKVEYMLKKIEIPSTVEELLTLKNTLEPFMKKENTDVDQKSL